MKFLVYFVLFFISSLSLVSQEFESKTIIVKFKSSSEFPQKLKNNEISEISEFLDILGKHKFESFINPALLKNLEKKKNSNQLLQSSKDNGLDRIYIINYEKEINPLILSKKIKSFNFIEYAEPKYIRSINEEIFPNDSLLNQQYYLNSIKAIESWELVDTSGKTVVVGVVDTGVDYLHEELKDNMFINLGEIGLDGSGNDKSNNNIDDDQNGFTDDFMGWDFGSGTSESGFDNDPQPGNPHGTHVAGIIAATRNNLIGIAGIGLNTKILPVKIGPDGQFSRNLVNSYSGLLYAAIAGANVINCSWGGGGYSQSEQDVVDEVIQLGSLIVAAAGNDYSETAYYPSSYKGVISVAAIDSLDMKTNFSNYHSTVDISAPGKDIMSTIPINNYDSWSGTSMASPIVSAVAGMVWLNFPDYNIIQIGEHLKATSENINKFNPGYEGMIGSGKVDAFNAMSESNPISLEIIDYKIYQEVEDGVISAGEKIEIEFEIFNALNTARNVNIYAYSIGIFQPEFIRDELFAGNFNEFEARKIDGRISFITPNEDVINYSLPITIKLVEESGKIFSKTISVFMNPNWRTMDENKISMTVTSLGNIAFDDFPYNNRGEGFKYLASSNMLFEGALMIGTAYNSLSNSARGDNSSFKNYDYEIIKPISTKNPGTIASEETYAEFKNKEDSLTVPLTILQSAYQFTGSGLDNQIYLVYDIINNSENYLDSVFVAMYQDWDIGTSGSLDRAVWNSDGNFAYIYNTKDINLPQAGVKMASNHKLNFWAIDNDGETEENPGVYDGFTKSEKWLMMTSGIARTYSSDTDVSCVIGAGPIRLRAGDTTRVTFVYFAGKDSLELLSTANSIETSKSLINADGDYLSNPQNSYISIIYPNPAQNYSIIEIALAEIENAELSLWDINGKRIKDLLLYDSKIHPKMYNGIYRINLNLSDLSQGQYFVRLKTNTQDMTKILQVIK